MSMDDIVLHPPFDVTRASHVELTVADLARSRHFYTELVGLAVSDEDASAVYLRGLEERGHHSLVLRRSDDTPSCPRLGLRVRTEDDLRAAERYFAGLGAETAMVERPFQGPTLHVADDLGVPLEFCATMELRPRLMNAYDRYRGAAAQRLDHYQLQVPDVRSAYDFYQRLGFRTSEYTYSRDDNGAEFLWGAWMQRKGNPHDVVFTNGPGPRLHHFAYTLREAHDMIHACDVAGSLGYGPRIERGPGRHGISGALFLYFRDPDGHRIELFNTHYQHIDFEPAIAWDLADPKRADHWGMPARSRWFEEATPFPRVNQREPSRHVDPPTLERFLQNRNR